MNKVRPFLKWAGNKYRCLDHILSSFPKAPRLIEPFTGSAALFMNTDYPNYLLAEDNADLIALFYHLQQEGVAFIEYCQRFFVEKNNNKDRYYEYRACFNELSDKRQRAAHFLYLNRHGYNGLCRYNSSGRYNVPFGRYKKPYFPAEEMRLFHKKSQSARFLHGDFSQTFLQAAEGDVIYCDPPYAPLNQTSNFSTYTSKKFTEVQQVILADCAKAAVDRGITVLISNHDTEFTRDLYRQANIKSFPVSRLINCKKNQRTPAQELLAIFTPI